MAPCLCNPLPQITFPFFAGKQLLILMVYITCSLRSLSSPSQAKFTLLSFSCCTALTYVCYIFIYPPHNITFLVQNSRLRIQSIWTSCLAYSSISAYVLDWWMNSVLPGSIIPCQSVLIATIFENLLCARHSIVVISFSFHTSSMNDKVLSVLRMKKLRLRKSSTPKGS